MNRSPCRLPSLVVAAFFAVWVPWLAAAPEPTPAPAAALHAAVGRPVMLTTPANPRYPGPEGAGSLTNGRQGNPAYTAGDWLGWEGPDMEATVDLGAATEIRRLAAGFLQVTGAGIFLPTKVEMGLSNDGQAFRTVATLTHDVGEHESGPLVRVLETGELKETARYVRVRASNRGTLPAWHPAGAIGAWLFCDEILVNPKPVSEVAFDLLVSYEPGQSRAPLAWIEERVRRFGSNPVEDGLVREHLVSALGGTSTLAAKRFCCRQLALVGTAKEVPVLVGLLPHAELGEAARCALATIPDAAAGQALVAVLPATDGAVLIGIVGSLGARHEAAAVPALVPLLGAGDEAVVGAAAGALGSIGSAPAAEALREAWTGAEAPRQLLLADGVLAAAESLLAHGDTPGARTLYGAVYAGTVSAQVRMAALAGLLATEDLDSVPKWLDALNAGDEATRRLALAVLRRTPATAAVGALTARLPALNPDVQAAVLTVLADRGEAAALPAVQQAAAHPNAEVRTAALVALGKLGNAATVPALVTALSAADSDAERSAARRALERLATPDVDAAILTRLASAEPATQTALIKCLATRRATGAAAVLVALARSPDAAVRTASAKALGDLAGPDDLGAVVGLLQAGAEQAGADELEKAALAIAQRTPVATRPAVTLTAALDKASEPAARARLVTVLGRLADPASYPALQKALGDADANVRSAAIRALTAWPEDTPVADLLTAAKSPVAESQRVLATRGAVALAQARTGSRPPAATVAMLRQAMEASFRDEERKLVLAATASVAAPEALALASEWLGKPGVEAEAEGAAVRIAGALVFGNPDLARPVLARVAAESATPANRQAARQVLDSIVGDPPAGYTPLFNGRDTEGWQVVNGPGTSWSVQDGLLTAAGPGKGWLATAREYADYELVVEFRVPAGGNSGVFLRAPKEGNPAFAGMEVQILDDAAEEYRDLSPGQYCGSLYGIAAPGAKATRPAGQWQRLVIACLGRQVTLTLNGVQLSQTNLDDHRNQADKIPGLLREQGFIGLQNEGGAVQFRGIWIREPTNG